MVKIWFDIETTKESWLFGTISKKLKEENIESVITARDYDKNKEILDILDVKYHIIGSHGGEKLEDKLVKSLSRALELTNFIIKEDPKPDYCVCLGSPSSSRVGFGLAIPTININDTPHAEKVGRLTVPLSDFLIIPNSIDQSQFIRFGIEKEKIITYNGVDEITWLKNFKPNVDKIKKLGIDQNKKLLLYRIVESKSAYFLELEKKKTAKNISEELLEKIIEIFPELQIIVLCRYEDQVNYYLKKFGDRIIVPEGGINGPNISYYADLVISGGGTMNREAALLGTPAICYFPLKLEVNEFVIKEKFPLWNENKIENIINRMKDILESKKPNKDIYVKKLHQYEDVYDALKKIILR